MFKKISLNIKHHSRLGFIKFFYLHPLFLGRKLITKFMKNKIIAAFLFSLLIPNFTFAAFYIPSSFDPGGKNNPFYFKEIQDNDAIQRNANTQKENNLKNTYGLSNYYACYSENESSCGIGTDTSNPSVQASCLIYMQYCLERKALSESRSNQSFQNQISCPASTRLRNGTCVSYDQICADDLGLNRKWDGTKNDTGGLNCGCKDGYAVKNGECVSYDQSCNITYPNTVFNKIDSAGIRICDCQNGYVWNDQRTSCVVAPVVDRNKQCQEKYPNSSLIGQYCDCGGDYRWNQDRTQCVITPIKSDKQTCVEKYDENWAGFIDTEGRLQCSCKSGYQFDITSGKCAIVPVKSSQQTCTESYGANSMWTGEKKDKNGPVCGCQYGYQWNQDRSSCVILNPKITPESSVMKKDSKSSERTNQQSSLNSSISNNDKSGNSSSIFLDKADLIYKDVSTTTIERKIPERKSVWKRMKGFFGF